MTIKHVIVSERGTQLNNPTDGFIINSSGIFASQVDESGSPIGGFIGPFCNENKDRQVAFSKTELLSALGYTFDDLMCAIKDLYPEYYKTMVY